MQRRTACCCRGLPRRYATKPADLSDLLLLDVETGVCEKASRIEEAITAVQTFVRRSRLGLEPGWKVGGEFIRLWDSRFDSYRVWERCKLRELLSRELDRVDRARQGPPHRSVPLPRIRIAQCDADDGGAGRAGLVAG